MTAEELRESISYTGQERCMRKVCIEKGLVPIEKLACMNCHEVCAVMVKHYEILGICSGGARILLVEKNKWEEVWDKITPIDR